MALGNRISELRKSHSMTQANLADKMNVSLSTVASWESDRRAVSNDDLISLANLFGVTTDYLLGVNGTPKWATEKDVTDLKKYLSGDQSFYYGGDKLTEEENEQLKVALATIFWKRHKK